MGTLELKNDFHNLIESITDNGMLEKFYVLMRSASQSSSGELWDALPESERLEILKADDESSDFANLISHDEMKKKHSKWL